MSKLHIFHNPIDRRLEKIGFTKVQENRYLCYFTRGNHVVAIIYKVSGEHIIQSYDASSSDANHIGNSCRGLTYKELKLFKKKFHQLIKRYWK